MGMYRTASVGYGFLFDDSTLQELAAKLKYPSDLQAEDIVNHFCQKEGLSYTSIGNAFSNADMQYIIGSCMNVDAFGVLGDIVFPIDEVDRVNEVAEAYGFDADFYVGVFTY